VLVHGETTTGVTLHHMDARADHGDIIAQRAVPIAIEDTALTLSRKLTAAARSLLAEMYPLIASGRAPRTPQDHGAATKFKRRTPGDGLVDWTRPAWQIYNLIRAVTHPFPGAFTSWDGRRVFLWAALPPGAKACELPPGTILGVGEGGGIIVATGRGILEVVRLQADGEPETDGATFFATLPKGRVTHFGLATANVVGEGGRAT
jgi:methionyl-tRNA formyltransferase